LDDPCSISGKDRVFSLRHHVQTGSGTHPVITCGSFRGSIAAGARSYHLTPSSVEFNNEWSYASSVPYVFVAWRLIKHMDNFKFAVPNQTLSLFLWYPGWGHCTTHYRHTSIRLSKIQFHV